jgi:hypothetical protein
MGGEAGLGVGEDMDHLAPLKRHPRKDEGEPKDRSQQEHCL